MTNISSFFVYVKDRWLLLLGVIAFILYKLPALHYPFYWDESWSYEPAIQLMYRHGPSLMPNAIDTNFSRGHPMLFYSASAVWMRVFGPGAFSQHVFALLLAVLLIVAVYEICNRLFSRRTAILTLAIIPLQVVFFVQSTFMLPEIMIALLSLLSLYFYACGKPALTCISLLALLFTKESGIVAGVLLGIHAFIHLFNKQKRLKERLVTFLSVLLPGIALLGFYLVQLKVNGWFFFPQHAGLISLKWDDFWGKMKGVMTMLFYNDLRVLLFQLLLFFSLITAINTRKIKYLLPAFIAFLVYLSINNLCKDISRQVVAIVLVAAVALYASVLSSFADSNESTSRKFIYLCVFFIIGYTSFCAVNFITVRYLMAALIIVLMFVAYCIDHFISYLYNPIYFMAMIVIIFIGQQGLNTNKGYGDTEMGAFDGMKVNKEIVDYLEEHNYYGKVIATGSFQDDVHLTDPKTGYLKGDKTFKHVSWGITVATDLVTFNSIDHDDRHELIKNDKAYEQVLHCAHGDVWAEIYKKK